MNHIEFTTASEQLAKEYEAQRTHLATQYLRSTTNYINGDLIFIRNEGNAKVVVGRSFRYEYVKEYHKVLPVFVYKCIELTKKNTVPKRPLYCSYADINGIIEHDKCIRNFMSKEALDVL